jgi:N-acetylglucosaminyl-diphospho-decaprenol L-rhamnosyltransferase
MKILDLAIVVVNWNTRDLLRDCLTSVCSNQGLDFQVCVVDNASADGSVEMVEREFPQTRVIRSLRNGGFAYANNIGLKTWGFGERGAADMASDLQPPALRASDFHGPRYALLLNSDTVVPPDGLAQIVAFMDAHPEAGAAGPKLIRLEGSMDLACRRGFPTPAASFYHFIKLDKLFPESQRFGRYNLTYLDPNQLTEVDSVNGAFMIVRAQTIEQVGLLDEAFFFGGEDLDWAFRIKAAGWKVYYNPAIVVQHVKRASYRRNPQAAYEFERAMWLFYRKHYRATTPRWLDALICLALALRGGAPLAREILSRTGSPESVR